MTTLSTFVAALVILGLVATIGALWSGLASMAHGGRYDQEHSDGFMSARVAIQAITIALILVAIALSLL